LKFLAFFPYSDLSSKGAALAGMDLLIFAFFFAFGTVSYLILLFFDAKRTGKPYAIAIVHIMHAR
jgi:hypothetical protein